MVANRNVSLTNYDEQLAAAQRRQKLSEMLQEQANAPIDIQSYKGVQAPIPWTAVLAKALQSGVAGYQGRKADEQKAAASKQDLASALELANASSSKMPNIQASMPMRTEQVQGPMAQPVGLQSMAPPIGATNGMVESKKHKLAAALAAQVAAQNPVPAAAPIAQAAPPMAAPQPDFRQELLSRMQANPGNYDQGLTQADFDKAKMAQPAAAPSPIAGAMVPPASAPVRPQTISIPDASLYPQSTERTPENRAQIALQGALSGGGPKTTGLGSMLYQNAQTQIEEQQKLDMARKEKGLDREEDVNRALSIVDSIPGASPDQKEFLRFQAKALGSEGLKSSLEQMAKNQFGEHYTAASPEQLEGYPKGTVGQVSTTTGKLSSVYNPTSDLNSTAQVMISRANLGLHAQEVGLSGQRLKLEEKRENRIGTGGLTPEENDAISKAAAEGRIDPTRLSSRSAKIQASILLANPGINFVNNHAIAAMTANPTFQNKAMLAQALPEVLENVRDAGQKLNFSNVQYIGKLQAWKNGQLNDPDFINYMSQRADALQTITNVMRATGATDKSIELEAKAAPETMSPAAFDAWYEGQMASLKPRLDRIVPMAIKIPGVGSAPAGGGSKRLPGESISQYLTRTGQ